MKMFVIVITAFCFKKCLTWKFCGYNS